MSPLASIVALWSRDDARSARQVEAEILEELRLHLELSVRDGEEAGLDPASARAEALRRFGSFEQTYRDCRRTQIGAKLMLQRITTVLVLFLLVAVVAQAVLMRQVQARSSQDMQLLANELTLLRASLANEFGPPVEVTRAPGGAFLFNKQNQRAETLFAELREGTLDALEALATQDPPGLGALYAVLRTREVHIAARVRAAELLGELGAADDPDRLEVIEIGDCIENLEAASEAQVFQELVDGNGVVRLPEVGFVHVAGLTWPAAQELIERRYSEYYAYASIALDMPSWRYQPLIDSLGDPEPAVRRAAARALERIGNPRAHEALLAFEAAEGLPLEGGPAPATPID